LNAALHLHDLIDAINLTISPTLVAGTGQRALDGPTEQLRHFRRRHVLIAGDHLLTRWERDRTC
jgi:riboflavin biosynthesis pyrimidine reductase